MGDNLAQYAKHRGKTAGAAHHWKQKGLLVFNYDATIDRAASDAILDARPEKYRGGSVNGRGPPKDGVPLGAVGWAEQMIATGQRLMLPIAEAVKNKENFIALQRELDYDRESGAVSDNAETHRQVVAEYHIVRSTLLSIPARVAARVAVLKSPEAVRSLLEGEIAEVLKGLTLDRADAGPVRGGGDRPREKAPASPHRSAAAATNT